MAEPPSPAPGLERSDGLLVVLNFVLLGAIVFLPFASRVLGVAGGLPTAVVLYASTNLVAATALLAMRVAAERLGLLRMGINLEEFHRQTRYTAGTFGVFLLSIPLALLSPAIATGVWNFIFVLVLVRTWRDRRRRRAPVEA